MRWANTDGAIASTATVRIAPLSMPSSIRTVRGRSVDSSRHSRIVSSITKWSGQFDRRPGGSRSRPCWPGKIADSKFLRAQALNPGRHLPAARRAHHRQRARRDMAEAHLEHRRSQDRLDKHVAHVARAQHAEQSVERKTMARIQREQHARRRSPKPGFRNRTTGTGALRIARPSPRLTRIPNGV